MHDPSKVVAMWEEDYEFPRMQFSIIRRGPGGSCAAE